jgi:hypothetical protein
MIRFFIIEPFLSMNRFARGFLATAGSPGRNISPALRPRQLDAARFGGALDRIVREHPRMRRARGC